MNKKKNQNENEKTFSDLTNLSWYTDENKIKVGISFQKIMAGDFHTLEVKEIFSGSQFQTWKIVITNDDKIHLLKSSRELK